MKKCNLYHKFNNLDGYRTRNDLLKALCYDLDNLFYKLENFNKYRTCNDPFKAFSYDLDGSGSSHVGSSCFDDRWGQPASPAVRNDEGGRRSFPPNLGDPNPYGGEGPALKGF